MKVARCIASVVLAAASMAALGCGQAPQERTVLVYAFDIPSGQEGKPDIDKAVAAVNRRVNPGWSWTKTNKVRRASDTTLEVRLRTSDPASVARIDRAVTTAGWLEFRMLADKVRHASLIEKAVMLPKDTTQLREGDSPKSELLAWWVPVAEECKQDFSNNSGIVTRTRAIEGRNRLEVLVVKDRYNVSGAFLTQAMTDVDRQGSPCVDFRLNAEGGKRFGAWPRANLPDSSSGRSYRLGILLDGRLYSAPTIKNSIHELGQINGSFSREEVNLLAIVLNAGALPAPLKKVSQRTEKP